MQRAKDGPQTTGYLYIDTRHAYCTSFKVCQLHIDGHIASNIDHPVDEQEVLSPAGFLTVFEKRI